MDLKSFRLNKMFLYFFLKKQVAVVKTRPETWLYPSCLPDRGVSTLTALSVVLDKNKKIVLFAKNTEKCSQIIFVEFCSLSKLGNDKAGHFGGKTWDQHSKRWLPTKSHIGQYSYKTQAICENILLVVQEHTSYLSQTPKTCLCKNFLSGVNFSRLSEKNAYIWLFQRHF